MSTPDTVFDSIDEAISFQTMFNIKKWGLYEDKQEKAEVISEEIQEVIEAFEKYISFLELYDSSTEYYYYKIKEKLIHLIEESIHTIAAINKNIKS